MMTYGSLGFLNNVKAEQYYMRSFLNFLSEQDNNTDNRRRNLSADPKIAAIQTTARSRQPLFPGGPTPYVPKSLDYSAIADELAGEEGFKSKVYKDTKGHPTIGYGHKFAPDSRRRFEAAGIGDLYSGCVGGVCGLTEPQARNLLARDVEDIYGPRAQGLVDNLKDYNPEFQSAAVGSTFRGGLPGSPITRGHINRGEYAQAESAFLDSEEYRKSLASGSGVAPRMQGYAQAFGAARKSPNYEYKDEKGRTQTRDPFLHFPEPTTPATPAANTTTQKTKEKYPLSTATRLSLIPNK